MRNILQSDGFLQLFQVFFFDGALDHL
jgi:hypothetical protein